MLKEIIFPQLTNLYQAFLRFYTMIEAASDLLTVQQAEGVQVLEDDLRDVPQLVHDGVAQYVFVVHRGASLLTQTSVFCLMSSL